LAALACGLDPSGADLVRPFIAPLEALLAADVGDTDMVRPLALSYVRTGGPEKAVPRLAGLPAYPDAYARHWQVLVLALPKAGGLVGLWRAALAAVVDAWYARERERLDWTERVIVPELRKQIP
jgi:hypothetical protein